MFCFLRTQSNVAVKITIVWISKVRTDGMYSISGSSVSSALGRSEDESSSVYSAGGPTFDIVASNDLVDSDSV